MIKPKGVGVAFGIFDLLHIGHLTYFQRCKEYCTFLLVGVYTDELALLCKRKPIIPFEERIELVEALKPVNAVIKVELTGLPMMKKLEKDELNVKFLFHSEDWTPEDQKTRASLKKHMKSINGKLIEIPYYKGRTTTGIINEIKKRGKKRLLHSF